MVQCTRLVDATSNSILKLTEYNWNPVKLRELPKKHSLYSNGSKRREYQTVLPQDFSICLEKCLEKSGNLKKICELF